MGRWKLIEWFESGRRELYDLKHDIGESEDLATSHPEQCERLYSALTAWRSEVDAPVPTEPNPRYDPTARPRR